MRKQSYAVTTTHKIRNSIFLVNLKMFFAIIKNIGGILFRSGRNETVSKK